MPVTQNKIVSPQTPKSAGIAFGAGTETTVMDPATVSPTALVTVGASGGLVTSLVVAAESTVALEKVVLWVQPGGAGNWYYKDSDFFAAYTQADTDAQEDILFVDPEKPDQAIRLGANDVLGVTHHIDQQSMAFAEWMDY